MKAIGLVECESQRTQTGYVYAGQSESLFECLYQYQNVFGVGNRRHVNSEPEIFCKRNAHRLCSYGDSRDRYHILYVSSFHSDEMSAVWGSRWTSCRKSTYVRPPFHMYKRT